LRHDDLSRGRSAVFSIRSAHPFGGLPAPAMRPYAGYVILLESGLIVAIVVFFIAIDLYVRGCEKI
jgi:hypothetical protein